MRLAICLAWLASCLSVYAKLSVPMKNGVIVSTDAVYDKVLTPKRDYWTVVLFTATAAQYSCEFCRLFKPEFDVLAHSYGKARKAAGQAAAPEVYFVYADFDKNQKAFAANKLANAPNLWVYPPNDGPAAEKVDTEPRRYDFNRGPTADSAAEFLRGALNFDFQVVKPFDYAKAGRFATSVVAILLSLVVIWRVAGKVLTSKYTWALASLALILTFNGGYMFTQIRNSPYKGGNEYVAGGFQEQFGAEVQIIAATCKLSSPLSYVRASSM